MRLAGIELKGIAVGVEHQFRAPDLHLEASVQYAQALAVGVRVHALTMRKGFEDQQGIRAELIHRVALVGQRHAIGANATCPSCNSQRSGASLAFFLRAR